MVQGRLQGFDRGDVDDRAVAGHRGRRLSRHRRHADGVDAEHLLELVVAERPERRDRLDARVVDDDVETAERLDRDRADRAGAALYVSARGGSTAAELLEQRLEPGTVASMHDDRRSRFVEAPGDTASDRAARARDERDAAAEVEQAVDRRRRRRHGEGR